MISLSSNNSFLERCVVSCDLIKQKGCGLLDPVFRTPFVPRPSRPRPLSKPHPPDSVDCGIFLAFPAHPSVCLCPPPLKACKMVHQVTSCIPHSLLSLLDALLFCIGGHILSLWIKTCSHISEISFCHVPSPALPSHETDFSPDSFDPSLTNPRICLSFIL